MENKNKAIVQLDGKEYTLEFSRYTAAEAEKRGFHATDLLDPDKMFSSVMDLFFYSFKMHHPEITREEADEIIDGMGGITTALLERLSNSYGDAITSLIVEGEPKNGRATVIL